MHGTTKDVKTVPRHIIACIRYLSYGFLAVGVVATIVGFIKYEILSSVVAYLGVTFLICGTFFFLASRSFPDQQRMKERSGDDEEVCNQLYQTTSDFAAAENERLTQRLRDEMKHHLKLTNSSGSCLVINISRDGLISFDFVKLSTWNLPMRTYTLKFIQHLEVNEIQNRLIQPVLLCLHDICDNNQYRNGRAYVLSNGSLCLKLWPSKVNWDEPPDYYTITKNDELPSYSDVTFVTAKDTNCLSTAV